MFIYVLAYCAMTVFAAIGISRAPFGYQDENGWHAGKEPSKSDKAVPV